MKYKILCLLLGIVCLCNAQPNMCFSVGADKIVAFSQGNLCYLPAKNQWTFLNYQYEEQRPQGYCDFGWATSGYQNMKGDLKSPRNTDYGPSEGDLDSTQYDWGIHNTIQNGDIYTWRTLNAEEWNYLLYNRIDAERLRGKAKVNGIPGLVLLPDNWVQPDNVMFAYGESYDVNIYSLVLWKRMEIAGAVFLPAAGYEWDGYSQEWHEVGYYWTTTNGDEQTAVVLKFDTRTTTTTSVPRRYGASVRLVRECQ